ncbi:hypothetical protein [Biformimicrobium ophioploci]|uniref:Uncharacterized protein n=1 Tax=Biformimicrobium ophioploci TaxID=3036711 RepID=A0ABQ6M007_9GAMM|nr:hypothetical protein [Microbulbifer sp. NKW57]GMG87666.1 hypothetical protein MNKW57_19870 [Microbulbifer sp. NKW57]
MAKKRSRRSFVLSILACLAFIGAAVFSWGMPVADVFKYLLLLLGILGAMILLALCAGALLNWLRARRDRDGGQ